ncbi:hypothetical protein GW891_01170 [bacterium]|nr:hypothetical protein [bacterium]
MLSYHEILANSSAISALKFKSFLQNGTNNLLSIFLIHKLSSIFIALSSLYEVPSILL